MIVLLTDFGHGEYVGVMKGVIYSLNPDARICDLYHDIRPGSIIEAAWVLKNSFRFFPKGVVFCCVVDPGVGTDRKTLAVKTRDYFFVAPDNGLLWEAAKEQEAIGIISIPVPSEASRTFHGRDVFAKAAAQIDLGQFEGLGEQLEQIERLELYRDGREGTVVRIDRFGNIITNLPSQDKSTYQVEVGQKSYQMKFYPTYSAAAEDELFLILGSCDTLEISIKNGSAAERLNFKPGERIRIS